MTNVARPNDFLKSKRTEHRIRAENLAFDIDVWYPKMEKYTFRSVFLPLSRSEAMAIREFHNCTWRNANKYGLKHSDLLILENLSNHISDEIQLNFQHQGGGAFMRLCGRSPKDGDPLRKNIAIDTYDHECMKLGVPLNCHQKLKQSSPPFQCHKDVNVRQDLTIEAEGNLRMVAIGRSTPSWLKINNGCEALNLLLTSERVYADMIDWLNFGEPEQVVLREWEPELTTEYEFRAFVFNNKMTAISQYDHYTAYPTLHDEKCDIKTAIVAAWKDLHSSVGECTYVADFAYLPSSKSAKLVELSPFLDVTGPALFNWSRDKGLLQGLKDEDENGGTTMPEDESDSGGDDENIVFRLLSQGHPQASDLVEANWENRWRSDEVIEEGDHGEYFDYPNGFWNLLPFSQNLALNPKTAKKRALPIHYLPESFSFINDLNIIFSLDMIKLHMELQTIYQIN